MVPFLEDISLRSKKQMEVFDQALMLNFKLRHRNELLSMKGCIKQREIQVKDKKKSPLWQQ